MTNLTPAQLEQFESTFRYFDKDETNTLSQTEMTAALASLGIVYSVSLPCRVWIWLYNDCTQDEDMNFIYGQLVHDYGAVTFEAFINLLVRLFRILQCSRSLADMCPAGLQVDITEDQTSPEQLREAFRGIAADKV